MTHTTEQERAEQVRAEFEAWCRRLAIDVSIKKDAWGRDVYAHDPVSLAWLAWKEQEEAYRAVEAWQAARRAPAVPVPQGLREAAQAVVERWDTPLWKDVPATAVYIADLRAALAAAPQPPEARDHTT